MYRKEFISELMKEISENKYFTGEYEAYQFNLEAEKTLKLN